MTQQTVFYRESDARPEALTGASVAVLGYGNLGRSVALNLRDSGLAVTVGNVDDEYRARAREEGFAVADPGDAVSAADVVYLLLPDEVIPRVFDVEVRPRLREGTALCFASGYVLAYGLVRPPADVDVLLLAPRMLGEEVRSAYRDGTGFLSYVCVEQDATGRAEERLLALTAAVGSLRRGAIRLSAEQEATLDLFVEQSVGPYLGVAFQTAFRVGVAAGLPPEALVCELYMSGEMARTITTMATAGFFESVRSHGLVAMYGGFQGTLGLDGEAMERHFRDVLEQIRSGGFARQLQEEEAQGYPILAVLESVIGGDDPITAAEQRVRARLGDPGRTAGEPRRPTSAPRRGGGTTAAPGEG
ncbi:ketol-acid reductoisomerase [Geodermatophilus sp. DF01-2]|nr:ketol-acid reductoisomerase [Geodermatophilus sp. DF01_2]